MHHGPLLGAHTARSGAGGLPVVTMSRTLLRCNSSEAGAGCGTGVGGDADSGAPGQGACLDIHCSKLSITAHFLVTDGPQILPSDGQVFGIFQQVLALHSYLVAVNFAYDLCLGRQALLFTLHAKSSALTEIWTSPYLSFLSLPTSPLTALKDTL